MPGTAAAPSGRRLVLLRHARAEGGDGRDDAARPLALDGRREASAVGARLVEGGWVPDHVLVSSAVRTRQTWELVRGALAAGGGGGAPVVTDRLYAADTGEAVALLREVPDDVRTLLVIGHEPTMSATAALLDGGTAPGEPEQSEQSEQPEQSERSEQPGQPRSDGDRQGSARARVRVGLGTASFAVLAVDGAWAALAPGRARLVDVVVPE